MGTERAELVRIAELVQAVQIHLEYQRMEYLGDDLMRCGICATTVKAVALSLTGPHSAPGDGIYYQCRRTEEHVNLPVPEIDGQLRDFAVRRLLDEPQLGLLLRARRLIEVEDLIAQFDELLTWRATAGWSPRRAVHRMLRKTRGYLNLRSTMFKVRARHQELTDERHYLAGTNQSHRYEEVLSQDWRKQPRTQVKWRRILLRTAVATDQIAIDTRREPNIGLMLTPAPDTVDPERVEACAAELRQRLAPPPAAEPAPTKAIQPPTRPNRATRRYREREERRQPKRPLT